MAEPLTEEFLAAVQARLDAAPVGPWPVTRDGYELPLGFGPFSWVQVFQDQDLETASTFAAAARTDVPALLEEIARLKATPTVLYRAEFESFILGHYDNRDQARAHCEATVRDEWPPTTTLTFTWDADDEENPLSPEELAFVAGQNEESLSGYVVTPLSVDRTHDAEADS